MVYDNIIKGKYVYLKSAAVDDAENTLAIRQDPKITKYLPALEISIDQQRDWLRKQNADPTDYFFVVKSFADKFLGTISIYNIKGRQAESGRLALIGDVFQKYEAILLEMKFAFEILKLEQLHGYVFAANKRALRFNEMTGSVIGKPYFNEKGEELCPQIVTKESFYKAAVGIEKILYK